MIKHQRKNSSLLPVVELTADYSGKNLLKTEIKPEFCIFRQKKQTVVLRFNNKTPAERKETAEKQSQLQWTDRIVRVVRSGSHLRDVFCNTRQKQSILRGVSDPGAAGV